jgi:hypothetical protein
MLLQSSGSCVASLLPLLAWIWSTFSHANSSSLLSPKSSTLYCSISCHATSRLQPTLTRYLGRSIVCLYRSNKPWDNGHLSFPTQSTTTYASLLSGCTTRLSCRDMFVTNARLSYLISQEDMPPRLSLPAVSVTSSPRCSVGSQGTSGPARCSCRLAGSLIFYRSLSAKRVPVRSQQILTIPVAFL